MKCTYTSINSIWLLSKQEERYVNQIKANHEEKGKTAKILKDIEKSSGDKVDMM